MMARCLLTDGTPAVTQYNGQVCFLKLHHGQRRISLAEVETLLPPRHVSQEEQFSNFAVSNIPYDPQSSAPERLEKTQETKKDYELILREGLEYHRCHYGSYYQGHHGHLCALIALLAKEGRLDEAKELTSERDEVAGQLPLRSKSDDCDRAINLNNRALKLRKQGELDVAESLLRQALAIDEKARGETHPKIPHRLNNLCTVLIIQGKLDEAKELLERAREAKPLPIDGE